MTRPCHAPTTLTAALGAMLAVLPPPAAGQPVPITLAAPEVLACAPRLAPAVPIATGRVVGAPDNPGQDLFRPGDPVLLDVGEAEGVSVGTQFYTRRVETAASSEIRVLGLRPLVSTGWVRAVEVGEHGSVAVVEHACAAIRRDDLLAPFVRPAPVSIGPVGVVDFDDPATVVFGTDGRSLVGPGDLAVIDQGADREIVPGQQLTIFRPSPRSAGDPITELATAVVMIVEPAYTIVQLVEAREPIRSGDLVAIHR